MPAGEFPDPNPNPLTPEDRGEIYGRPTTSDWRRFVKPTLWGLLALFALILVLSNRDDVELSFVMFTLQTQLIWVMLLFILIGVGLDEGFRFWRRYRRRGAGERGREG